jgi:integrase/recombinase XerD
MIIPNYPSIVEFQQLVELKDYRPHTKTEYVRYVRKLAEHFQCDPALLCEAQVRQYFLYLRQHKHYAASPMKLARVSLRAFYREVLKVQGWTIFEDLKIRQPEILPVVLSRAEVQQVLASVHEIRFQACLRLMYHCGLRISEAVALQARDLHDSRTDHPRLHVRNAKGGKDRFVPMSPTMVAELRQFWSTHKNRTFLFPSPGPYWADRGLSLSQKMHRATHSMSVSSVQTAFKLARAQSGINPGATSHTLRHSYATHLLEEGISLLQISRYLGHESLDTTVVYAHLTAVSEARTLAVLTALHQALGRPAPGTNGQTMRR